MNDERIAVDCDYCGAQFEQGLEGWKVFRGPGDYLYDACSNPECQKAVTEKVDLYWQDAYKGQPDSEEEQEMAEQALIHEFEDRLAAEELMNRNHEE